MPPNVDPFVRARVICELLGGRCRRTLFDMIERGDFPKPDRKAQRRGEPDLWRKSTVERAIAKYAAGEKCDSGEQQFNQASNA